MNLDAEADIAAMEPKMMMTKIRHLASRLTPWKWCFAGGVVGHILLVGEFLGERMMICSDFERLMLR